jgi:hypothetical protein
MMRLCVIVPNQNYLEGAGYRIRYARMREHLEKLGLVLESRIAGEFRKTDKLEHDAYLLSKGYDMRNLAVAHWIKASGRPLGVDLFDDYFSQIGHPRLIQQREWLRSLAGLLDFVLCSTPRMLEVAAAYVPGRPLHLMNDAFGSFDAAAIADTVERNLERARLTRKLSIGWFGVGDNPVFDVGLNDLVAFAPELKKLQWDGLTPHLSILTNARAMSPGRLALLRSLPLSFDLEEWSEERETALIASSLVCFLPVSGQLFSIAKSLNRAVSTLTGGAQVLSAGFPLYERLGEFIYRDPLELVSHLKSGQLRMRRESLPALRQKFLECADPSEEASRLSEFIRSLIATPDRGRITPNMFGVLHGQRAVGETHKFVQGLGQLSIAGPLTTGALNFDIAIVEGSDGLSFDMEVAPVVMKALDPAARERLEKMTPANGRRTHRLVGAITDPAMMSWFKMANTLRGRASASIAMATVNHEVVRALQALIPNLTIMNGEVDPLFVAASVAPRTVKPMGANHAH